MPMNHKLLSLLRVGAFGAALAQVPSFAVISYDQNVTSNAIFGSGNGNGSWTVDLANNVEVGLRAKVRGAGVYNSQGNGTYLHNTGISSGSAAKWNFEFSINVDQNGLPGLKIADFDITLGVDVDPTQGQSFVFFSPFAFWNDNSFGDNTTAQSGGIEANNFVLQGTYMSTYNLAQNSQNIGWLPLGFDVNADATYDFKLIATGKTSGLGAETSMRVIVGQGGAAVPDSGATVALVGFALAGLVGLRRRFVR